MADPKPKELTNEDKQKSADQKAADAQQAAIDEAVAAAKEEARAEFEAEIHAANKEADAATKAVDDVAKRQKKDNDEIAELEAKLAKLKGKNKYPELNPAKTVRVRALKQGYCPLSPGGENRIIKEGTEFVVADPSKLGRWMEVLGQD